MKTHPFFGKWALVTGASNGIGRSIAEELASLGANLILISRTKSRLDDFKKQLEAQHQIQIVCLPFDLSDPHSPKIIQQFCQEHSIVPQIIVNNAGYALKTAEEINQPDLVTQLLQLTVTSLTEICYRFLPDMIVRREGYILNIASVVAYFPVASTLVYHAAKSYVLAFTRSLHWEYSAKGIHITCSLPGATKTGFAKASGLYVPEKLWRTYGSAESVAKASIQALLRNQPILIPGLGNKMMVWLSRFVPHYWIYAGQKKYWSRIRSS